MRAMELGFRRGSATTAVVVEVRGRLSGGIQFGGMMDEKPWEVHGYRGRDRLRYVTGRWRDLMVWRETSGC